MGPFRFLFVNPIQPDIVDFTPPPSRVKVDVAFAVPDTQLPACQNVLLWNFRDGSLIRGRTARPTSQRPGKYLVRFSMRGYGSNACIGSHGVICAKRWWSSSYTGNEMECENRWADVETLPSASRR